MRILFLYCTSLVLTLVTGHGLLCGNETQRSRSCITQILGHNHSDISACKVESYPSDSLDCEKMTFSTRASNAYIGGVSLRPYILHKDYRDNVTFHSVNYTVLNITFSNIKWTTMKFRFRTSNYKYFENHCRNIVISNDVTVNDQSVLFYDCYWSAVDKNYKGQTHILDFEATDDKVVSSGRYFFNIPSAAMLSETVTEEEWKPFIYIEILTSTLVLHIVPPPKPLNIMNYRINTMRECGNGTRCSEVVKSDVVSLKNSTDEVIYKYSFLGNWGSYYFNVTPLHEKCLKAEMKCQAVESPRVFISSNQTLTICIASVTALIVATLFAYYVALRVIRRYWCKDYKLAFGNEIRLPTKVLVVYSPANRLHAECVYSFVNYLRSEYSFDILYDGDISSTSHGDPFIWAEEAYRLATHIMYIVGPKEETNFYTNIYEKPIISAVKDVDKLILSLIKSNRVAKHPKDILNIFFEHSDGALPVETRHEKVFFLLKDWQKLIAYLTKHLQPKKQIMRTEKGRCFLEDLTRAKKLIKERKDDVIVKCDKLNIIEKKVLL